MNKYQDMKLGKILAIAGCKMVPHGSTINVVAADGVTVLNGDIDEIRERVAFNCYYYGDPIVHPSATPFNQESAANKTERAAAAFKIQKAMDSHLADYMVDANSDASDDSVSSCSSGSSAGIGAELLDAIKKAGKTSVMGGAGARSLPENRVGALQEKYQPSGIIPEYRFVNNRGPPHTAMHVCIVKVGPVTCRGKGKTKKDAKQEAAGVLLLRIMAGEMPVMSDPPVARTGKKTRVTQEQIDAWEETPVGSGGFSHSDTKKTQ